MTQNFLTKWISSILIRRGMARAIALVHDRSAKQGAMAAIDLLFEKECELIMPMQYKEELLPFSQRIANKKPKVVLEIGTATGGTLLSWCLLADDNATLISLDLPDGPFGGGYPAWKTPLYRSFAKPGQTIHLIRGDSHSATIHEKVERILGGRKVDFLFIDGDHTYEGVKQDFQTYTRLVDPQGLIAFHDIAPDRAKVPDHFVSVFWNEVRGGYSYQEFIKDREQSKWGLGLISLDGRAQ